MVRIVKGEEKTLLVDITDDVSGKPYDVTDADEIRIIFKKPTGVLTRTLTESGGVTIIDGKLGEIQVHLTEANTAELREDPAAPMEIEIVEDGVTKVIQLQKVLEVIKRLS